MSQVAPSPSSYDNPFSGLAERLSQAINKINVTLTPQKGSPAPNTSGTPNGIAPNSYASPMRAHLAGRFDSPAPESPSRLEAATPANDSPHHRLVHPPSVQSSKKKTPHPVVARLNSGGGDAFQRESSLDPPQRTPFAIPAPAGGTPSSVTSQPVASTPGTGGGSSIRSRLAQRALQRSGSERAQQSFSRQQLVHPPQAEVVNPPTPASVSPKPPRSPRASTTTTQPQVAAVPVSVPPVAQSSPLRLPATNAASVSPVSSHSASPATRHSPVGTGGTSPVSHTVEYQSPVHSSPPHEVHLHSPANAAASAHVHRVRLPGHAAERVMHVEPSTQSPPGAVNVSSRSHSQSPQHSASPTRRAPGQSPQAVATTVIPVEPPRSASLSPYGVASGVSSGVQPQYSPALSSLTSLSDDTYRAGSSPQHPDAALTLDHSRSSPHHEKDRTVARASSVFEAHRMSVEARDPTRRQENAAVALSRQLSPSDQTRQSVSPQPINDRDVDDGDVELSIDIPEPQRRAIERVREASKRMREAREAATLEAMDAFVPDPDEIRRKEEEAAEARLKAQRRVAAAMKKKARETMVAANTPPRRSGHTPQRHAHAHHQQQQRTAVTHHGAPPPQQPLTAWDAEEEDPDGFSPHRDAQPLYPPTTAPRRRIRDTASETAAIAFDSSHRRDTYSSDGDDDDNEYGYDHSDGPDEESTLLQQLREQQIQARHRKVVQDMQRQKEQEQADLEARKNRVKWARERANHYHREHMKKGRKPAKAHADSAKHDRPWGASANYHKGGKPEMKRSPPVARPKRESAVPKPRTFRATRSETGPRRPQTAPAPRKRKVSKDKDTRPVEEPQTARGRKKGGRDYDKPWLSHARPVSRSQKASNTTAPHPANKTGPAAKGASTDGQKGVSKVTSARRAKRRAELEARDGSSLAVTLIADLKALLYNALSLQEIMNNIRGSSTPTLSDGTAPDSVDSVIELMRTHLDRVKRIYGACLDAAVELPGHVDYDDEDGDEHVWHHGGQAMRYSDPSQISQERQQMDTLRNMVVTNPLASSEATEVMDLLGAKLSANQAEFDSKFEWARVVLLRRAETLNAAKADAGANPHARRSAPAAGSKRGASSSSGTGRRAAERTQQSRARTSPTERAARPSARHSEGPPVHSQPPPLSDAPPLQARFQQALKEMHRGEHGIFRDIPLDANDLKKIASAVKKNPNLISLDFTHCQIGDDGVTALADAIEQSPSVQAVMLGDNGFGYRGAWAIAGALGSSQISHLDVSWNELTDRGVEELARAVLASHSITSVDLSGVSLTQSSATAFLKAIYSHKYLHHLSLTWNNLDDESGFQIASLLQHNTVLRVLNLSRNALGDRGAHFVANALSKNGSLLDLNMSGNHIGFEGTRSLGLAIMDNKSLKSLALDGNDIDEKGFKAFASALRDNSTLERVDLRYNTAAQRAAEVAFAGVRSGINVLYEPQRDPTADA